MLSKKIDINQQIEWCFAVLGTSSAWIYKYPMGQQYDVYNDGATCFEVNVFGDRGTFVLTINDNVFVSDRYDNKVRANLEKLWNQTKNKYEMTRKEK